MARSRNIKPGFFTNGDLLECSPLARLLFAGLWCEADRRGVLKDQPKSIKVKVLPGDNCDANELLDELAERGFIERYAVNGERCIWIVNFQTHQNPHVNERPSMLPAPPQHATNPDMAPYRPDGESGSAPDKHDANTVQAPEQHSTNPADSLNTDSLIRIPETGKRKSSTSGSRPRVEPDPAGFAEFWTAYPKRTNRKAAVMEFRRLKPDAALLSTILAAIKAQAAGRQWQEGFVPEPARWLKDQRWTDEVEPPRPLTPPPVIPRSRAPVETFNGSPVYDSRGVPTAAFFLRDAARQEAESMQEQTGT